MNVVLLNLKHSFTFTWRCKNRYVSSLLTVALTHLDDPDNARQAYEQAAMLDQYVLDLYPITTRRRPLIVILEKKRNSIDILGQ